MLKALPTEQLTKEQKERLFQLWNKEYPATLAFDDLKAMDAYLENLDDVHHTLYVDAEDEIQGWYFDFVRDDDRWFVIFLDEKYQRRGQGTQILNDAKKARPELHGWSVDHNHEIKKDGSPYLSPLAFYEKNGFEIVGDMRMDDENLSVVKVRWKR